jgi:raffinose/stachyose/melibiose transport system substrate-binding protein
MAHDPYKGVALSSRLKFALLNQRSVRRIEQKKKEREMRRVLSVVVLLLLITGVAVFASPVQVSWWNIGTAPTDKAFNEAVVAAFMKANPNIQVNVTLLENEAFKTKLATVMQSGNPPDLFQSWGGGVMVQYAQAGLLKDVTSYVKGTAWGATMAPGVLGVYAYDGKQYGIPYDMGAVTFWYNKTLLAKAGITAFPSTWSGLMTAVDKLKAAGITPIALGEGDKWPGHFWFGYLAVKIGGKAAFDAVLSGKGAFTDAPFVKAGQALADLNAKKPFQDGFLAATFATEGGLMGDGKAAMELMGQWAPGNEASNSVSKKGIADVLGCAPFPSVEGGVGLLTDTFGGGNGYAVGKNAAPEALKFLQFLTSKENQSTYAATGNIIPTVKGAETAIADPNARLVKAIVDKAGYFQLYLDQFFPPAVGNVVLDGVQGILANTMTPAAAGALIQKSWEENK